MDRINKVIADLVTQTGETDKAIAAKLGISPQLLGQYKSGKKKPGFEVIQKFNSVFNQDLVKLASNDETKVSRGSASVVTIDKYDALVNDLRENNKHLRDSNSKFIEIIAILSSKVGASQNA